MGPRGPPPPRSGFEGLRMTPAGLSEGALGSDLEDKPWLLSSQDAETRRQPEEAPPGPRSALPADRWRPSARRPHSRAWPQGPAWTQGQLWQEGSVCGQGVRGAGPARLP